MRRVALAVATASLAIPVFPTIGRAEAHSYNGRIWQDSHGRYRCKRPDGTVGLIVGGAGGALIGHANVEEMARYINADSLAFISIDGLYRAVGDQRDSTAPQRCDACFTGNYPTTLTDCDKDGKLKKLSLVASR